MKSIRERIEEKIGNNYEELFHNYIKKHPKAKRAFFVLASTKKIARNGAIYFTGLKIEMKDNKLVVCQHRQTVNGSTYEIV